MDLILYIQFYGFDNIIYESDFGNLPLKITKFQIKFGNWFSIRPPPPLYWEKLLFGIFPLLSVAYIEPGSRKVRKVC